MAHATISTQVWQCQSIINSFPGWCNGMYGWCSSQLLVLKGKKKFVEKNFLGHERDFPYRAQHHSPRAFSQIRWKRLQAGAGEYLF